MWSGTSQTAAKPLVGPSHNREDMDRDTVRRPSPPAPPEMAEFRYREALAAVKAIEQTIGGSYSEFHRRYVEAKVRVDGLSGSGPREEGLRKVMHIFEQADYKMSLGSGNPGSYGMQSGIELCVRAQAALASLVAAQAETAAPTPTAR